MDRVNEYREIVKRIIREYAEIDLSSTSVEAEVVFNDDTDHYELIYSGWRDQRRVHGTVLHVDIRDGKIWVQHDGTEEGIAGELLEAGVPHEHIVLAFHPPQHRRFTPFAVG